MKSDKFQVDREEKITIHSNNGIHVRINIRCLACGNKQIKSDFKLVGCHAMRKVICEKCKKVSYVDLPYCHSIAYPFNVVGEGEKLMGGALGYEWYGLPLLMSLKSPRPDDIVLSVEKKSEAKDIIFLPCIDYLYGHALLKLLQVNEHIDRGEAVVVLVPNFLRWMVPAGVSEIWTVNVSLKNGREYFPSLSENITKEFKRFDSVDLSQTNPHPSVGLPTEFTHVQPHDWGDDKFRISFIWRNDRLWAPEGIVSKAIHAISRTKIFEIWIQKLRIIRLMKKLKNGNRGIKYTVVGIGSCPKFPKWVDVKMYTPPLGSDEEMELCKIYAESRIVIGVHGSNMLLPSWHAGATIDLMPKDRWGNLAQDILFRDKNPRYGSIRFRFISIKTPINELIIQIEGMLRDIPTQLTSFNS